MNTSNPINSSSKRVTHWRLRTTVLEFGRQPLLMGIVNVTPDSFSDGGKFLDTQAAVQQGLCLIEQGADLLDIGGESTRPGAKRVEPREELRRVLPVITALCEQTTVPVSVDTSKALVARESLQAGAEIINDITALTGDSAMLEVVLDNDAAVCLMHMQGTPQTMQAEPKYNEVVIEVLEHLAERRDWLLDAGVEPSRIALDPGIGFGKTMQHNLALLASMRQFHCLGCPLLVGHSRKSFIGQVLNSMQADRLPGTIGVALAMSKQGVQILRVHDVGPVWQALRLFDVANGMK